MFCCLSTSSEISSRASKRSSSFNSVGRMILKKRLPSVKISTSLALKGDCRKRIVALLKKVWSNRCRVTDFSSTMSWKKARKTGNRATKMSGWAKQEVYRRASCSIWSNTTFVPPVSIIRSMSSLL